MYRHLINEANQRAQSSAMLSGLALEIGQALVLWMYALSVGGLLVGRGETSAEDALKAFFQ